MYSANELFQLLLPDKTASNSDQNSCKLSGWFQECFDFKNALVRALALRCPDIHMILYFSFGYQISVAHNVRISSPKQLGIA